MTETMKRRFQIRDADFGLAIYEAFSAADALADYLADRARADARATAAGQIQTDADGDATVTVDGETFYAIAQ
jgi:hypothetical protein